MCKDNVCCSAAVGVGSSYVQAQKMATVENVLECKVQRPRFLKMFPLDCSYFFFIFLFYQCNFNLQTFALAAVGAPVTACTGLT